MTSDCLELIKFADVFLSAVIQVVLPFIGYGDLNFFFIPYYVLDNTSSIYTHIHTPMHTHTNTHTHIYIYIYILVVLLLLIFRIIN